MRHLFILCFALSTLGRLLSRENLLSGSSVTTPVPTSEFLPQAPATRPAVQLQGTLSIKVNMSSTVHATLWEDTDPSTAYPQPFDTPERRTIPDFSFDYILRDFDLLPVQGGLQENLQPSPTNPWEWILQPSRCWHEPEDGNYNRCVVLFALTEAQQNCVYNGFFTFLIAPGSRQTSQAWMQLRNSYCAYYQFNTRGWAEVTYTAFSSRRNVNKDEVASKFDTQQAALFPVDTITNLPGFAGTLEENAFNNYTEHGDCSPVPPYGQPMGFYGVVHNNKFYKGISATRSGPHPYPEHVVYPAYSTAKSNYAALLLGALDAKGCIYPATINDVSSTKCIWELKVADWVAEADATWIDTNLLHLLDQSTNHYNTLAYGVDEGNLATNINFFYGYSTAQKLQHALYGYAYHPETPLGTVFNYHTTNEFLISYMVNKITQKVFDLSVAHFYKTNVCTSLRLSELYCNAKESLGAERVPFAGYGAFYTQDDLAKLMSFWTYSTDGRTASGVRVVSEEFFRRAMQQDASKKGVPTNRRSDPLSTCYPASSRLTPIPNQRYQLGFWSDNTMGSTTWTGVPVTCNNPKLVFMSGYGGIRVMIAKQAWAYVQLNDNYDFKVGRAVASLSNSLGCPQGLFSEASLRRSLTQVDQCVPTTRGHTCSA